MFAGRSLEYGIVALIHIAKKKGRNCVTAEEIAERYNISVEYLLKIMNFMSRAGILLSKRGPKGGFWLAKPAEQISFLEIVEAVNSPMRHRVELAKSSMIKRVFKECLTEQKNYLRSRTLKELL